MNFDIFISHSSKNKNIADAVTAGLEARGLRCWIAPRDIIPGEDYAKQIVNAIKNTKAFVLIFSEEANRSNFVLKEVERAVSQGIPIVPFRIEDIMPTDSMELYISSAHWLDAFTMDMDKHIEKLSGVMSLILNEPLDKNVHQKSLTKPDTISKKRKKHLYILVFLLVAASIFAVFFSNKVSKISVASVNLDSRVYIERNDIERIVSDPMYLEYTMGKYGNFDFRNIYDHEQRILPRKYKEKIEQEIKNYILFLNKKIEDTKNNMVSLSKLDNIEIATLFFRLMSEENFLQNLSVDEQKIKLKDFFNNQILNISKTIDYLKNKLIIENRIFIKLKVLNNNTQDELLKNSIKVVYKDNVIIMHRVKQPISDKSLHSVPVSNGNTLEESYDKNDFKIIPKKSIVQLWYTSDKKIKFCLQGEIYKIIMYNKSRDLISKIFNCKGANNEEL